MILYSSNMQIRVSKRTEWTGPTDKTDRTETDRTGPTTFGPVSVYGFSGSRSSVRSGLGRSGPVFARCSALVLTHWSGVCFKINVNGIKKKKWWLGVIHLSYVYNCLLSAWSFSSFLKLYHMIRGVLRLKVMVGELFTATSAFSLLSLSLTIHPFGHHTSPFIKNTYFIQNISH